MNSRLIIVGAGGHGRSVAEAVTASSGAFEIVGFLDDVLPVAEAVWGIPVLGKVADWERLKGRADCWFVAIGNNAVRSATSHLIADAGLGLATVVHPRAIVSPRAIIGAGSAVMAGAVIGTEAVLGMGTIVNCGAVVDHHGRVGDFGHLGVGAVMAGGSVLGDGAWMQANSALGYGVVIEEGRVLAPGEAVSR